MGSLNVNDKLEIYAKNGNLERVIELLECGANVHVNGDYPLRSAARNGYPRVVFTLLQYGADVHADNDLALQLAAQWGHSLTVTTLLNHNADIHADNDHALRLSAKNGNIKTVTVLLERGANVHADNDYALRYSARNGYTKTVNKLLSYGANAGANDDEALLVSVTKANFIIFTKLFECDSNISRSMESFSKDILNIVVDNYLNNISSNNNHLEIIAKLLERGANMYFNDGYILKQIYNGSDENCSHKFSNENIMARTRKKFEKDLADIILPYCQMADYHYFPDAYIKENVVLIKNAKIFDS